MQQAKINIGTYFDTLFSLLDRNDDGQIDSRELEPVLEVMALARMTAVDSRERPRDWFINRVIESLRSLPELPLWLSLSAAVPSNWSPV